MKLAKKYRKKPVVIEAVQFDGSERSIVEILALQRDKVKVLREDAGDLLIPTLEGTMRASVGDYVIRGVQGELYPCKPDIFEQTYDLVEE
jgi:hypothetical protein